VTVRALPTLSALALAILLATPAVAADPSTVIVYEPGDGTGEQTARTAWSEQFGHTEGVRFVSIEEVFPSDDAVVLLGDAALRSCAGAPLDGEDFAARVDAVAGQVLMMDYLAASGALAELEADVPCLADAPPPPVLGGYHILRGLVAWYAETPEIAADRFEEGLLVSPFLQWDDTWPPQVRPSFDAALAGALTAGTAFLSISESITARGPLWLDGLVVDPRTRTTTLNEGTHLIQWKDEAGRLTSWVAHVGDGSSLELVHRDDAVAALLSGRAEPELTAHAHARVLAPVEREAGSRMFVAQPWEVVLFHEFDAAAGRWWLTDLAALESWRASGRRLRAGGVGMLIGGAATLLAGAVVGGLGRAWSNDVYDDIFPGDVERADGSLLSFGSAADLSDLSAEYGYARDMANAGVGIAVVGGVITIGGLPLAIGGHRRARATGLHKGGPWRPDATTRSDATTLPAPEPEPESDEPESSP
jgi:hypothetical protein